jgi:hypothetical protein
MFSGKDNRGVKTKQKEQVENDVDVPEADDLWEERRNEFNEVYWYFFFCFFIFHFH